LLEVKFAGIEGLCTDRDDLASVRNSLASLIDIENLIQGKIEFVRDMPEGSPFRAMQRCWFVPAIENTNVSWWLLDETNTRMQILCLAPIANSMPGTNYKFSTKFALQIYPASTKFTPSMVNTGNLGNRGIDTLESTMGQDYHGVRCPSKFVSLSRVPTCSSRFSL
jgi:hypothetical protein